MARYLIIVASDQPDLYEYLRGRFSEVENVQVLLDRRQGDRRQHVQGCELERRLGERRLEPPRSHALQTIGMFLTRTQQQAS